MSIFFEFWSYFNDTFTRPFRLNVLLIHKIDKHLFLELHVYKSDRWFYTEQHLTTLTILT